MRYLIYIVLILSSCKKDILKNTLTFKLNHKIIDNPDISKQSGFYSISGFINENSDIKLFYFFNDTALSLSSLSGKGTFHINVPLYKAEPVYSLAFNNHYYYLEASGNLYQFSKNDTATHKLCNLNDIKQLEEDGLKVCLFSESQNYFHISGNTIIFPLMANGRKDKKFGNFNVRFPLFGKMELSTHKFEYLPCYADDDFYAYSYHLHNRFFSHMVGDTLYVYYPYNSKISRVSVSGNKLLEDLELKDNFSEDKIAKTKQSDLSDANEMYRYSVESPYYSMFIYNPYKKHYYRLYYHELPRLNKNEEFTIPTDKKVSLIVYNHQFKYLGEYQFPEKYIYLKEITPTPEGVLLNSFFTQDQDHISYNTINYD